MDKQTTELLQQLAAKLGTTSEYLWSILIKQAYVSVVIDIIFYGIGVTFVYLTYKYAPKLWKKGDAEETDLELAYYFAAGGMMLIAGISALCTIIGLPYTLGTLINPEYWALKQILDAIKPAS